MAVKRIWWLNRSIRWPLLSTRNLVKFHEMHPGLLRFRNLNKGCELGPLTSTFEKVSAKATCCWLRNDLISAEVFSGIPMNWLLGKKRTTQSKTKSCEDCYFGKHELDEPSRNFSANARSWLMFCFSSLQSEAMLTINMHLPEYFASFTSLPSRSVALIS